MVELPKREIVYVVTHIYQGILVDVRAFAKEEDADKYEKDLCKQNNLPFDRDERHMTESDDDISQWVLEIK
jgi:hypothetical protein